MTKTFPAWEYNAGFEGAEFKCEARSLKSIWSASLVKSEKWKVEGEETFIARKNVAMNVFC